MPPFRQRFYCSQATSVVMGALVRFDMKWELTEGRILDMIVSQLHGSDWV